MGSRESRVRRRYGCSYRSDDTGAVGADQSSLVLCLEDVGDADHVVLGDTLSDADNEADLSGDGLLDTGSGKGRTELQLALFCGFEKIVIIIRNEDSGSCSTGLLHGIANAAENGTVKVHRAGLLGVGTTDDICACPV